MKRKDIEIDITKMVQAEPSPLQNVAELVLVKEYCDAWILNLKRDYPEAFKSEDNDESN